MLKWKTNQKCPTYIYITASKNVCSSKRTGKNIIQGCVTEIEKNVNLYIEMFHDVPVNIDLKGSVLRHFLMGGKG